MIGRLRGPVLEISEDEVLIEAGGVGYIVRAGSRSLSRLPAVGEEAILHIESKTSEDGTRLYGFFDRNERRCFQMLQAIQGVGPKAALAVLDVLSPSELSAACSREDKAAVARANGVGPKLALRIVTELKDKIVFDVAGFVPKASEPLPFKAPVADVSPLGEAVSALMGLGHSEINARRYVEMAAEKVGADAPISELIRAALKESGR